MRKKDHYKICCFIFLGGVKYHKKDENWLVDELRVRRRPVENPNQQLSEVLRRSEVFERGEGLLPVRKTFFN